MATVEPILTDEGTPAVEKLTDDMSVVREKLTGSDDKEFMKMMGLKAAGEQEVEETDETAEEQVQSLAEEAVEKVVEEADSRERRQHKADAARRGLDKKPVEEEKEVEEAVEEAVAEKEKELPEGEQAKEEAEKEEEKPLLTQFVLKQGTEEVDIPRDVTLTFKANGKDYSDVPLDKVVLLAQMGFYNEAREQEVQLAKKYVAETSQKAQNVEELNEKLRKEFDELLNDEGYYEAARQEYLKRNSPEERARRAEDSLRQQRRNEAAAEQTRQAQTYIQTAILPSVEKILQTFNSVSEDEVMGRFNRLITPYLVNGVVPPQNLPMVKQLVEGDLASWAQAVTVERDTARAKQAEKTDRVIKAEKVKTTLAKRDLARVVKPQGTVSNVKEAKKPKQYKSAQEWADTAIDELLANR